MFTPLQPLELLKTRFQLNQGQPMRVIPAVRGEGPLSHAFCSSHGTCYTSNAAAATVPKSTTSLPQQWRSEAWLFWFLWRLSLQHNYSTCRGVFSPMRCIHVHTSTPDGQLLIQSVPVTPQRLRSRHPTSFTLACLV